MDKRAQSLLLIVAAVLLLLLAGKVGMNSMRGGTSELRDSVEFQKMSPDEQQKAVLEGERDRRKIGKPPTLHLPEDPPGFPPGVPSSR